jgi:hypothetical protein
MAVNHPLHHERVTPPSDRVPAVPEWLDTLDLKCLAKDPADRYQTTQELLADLASQDWSQSHVGKFEIKPPPRW